MAICNSIVFSERTLPPVLHQTFGVSCKAFSEEDSS